MTVSRNKTEVCFQCAFLFFFFFRMMPQLLNVVSLKVARMDKVNENGVFLSVREYC